jgi:hypothetical protein
MEGIALVARLPLAIVFVVAALRSCLTSREFGVR